MELGEAILKIKQDFGDEIIEDIPRLNALIMDYAPEIEKERKLLIRALEEGLLFQIRWGLEKEKNDLETVARKCAGFLVSEMWITEKAARYVVGVVIQAMGYDLPTAGQLEETTETAERTAAEKQLMKGEASFGAEVKEDDLRIYSSIGYKAFASNEQLVSISVPENIKKIYPRAFLNCTRLKKVCLTGGTEIIGWGAFDGCTHLEDITTGGSPYYTVSGGSLIGKKNKELLKNLGGKAVSVPRGVRRIHRKAFESSQVEQVSIPGTVEVIEEDAFWLTMKLRKIEVDRTSRVYKSCDGVLYSRDGRELIRYPQGKTDVAYYLEDDAVRIGKKAFSCASSLVAVTFTGTLKEICENAFEYCAAIENVILPGSVEIIGDRAFQYCEKMGSVMLPRGIVRIGDCAFLGCSSLRTVSIPGSVREIGNMAFAKCRMLSRVVIQRNVTFIGDRAFAGCPNIEVSVKGNEYAATYCRTHGIRYTVN